MNNRQEKGNGRETATGVIKAASTCAEAVWTFDTFFENWTDFMGSLGITLSLKRTTIEIAWQPKLDRGWIGEEVTRYPAIDIANH